jgi:hypothetical protein
LPGFRLFGRWWLIKPSTRRRQVELVRLFPKSLGLPPMVDPSDMIQAAFTLGYQPCPDEVIDRVKELMRSRRRGYIIAPNSATTSRLLLVWTRNDARGGAIDEVNCPYPTTYLGLGDKWSIVVAKPWD